MIFTETGRTAAMLGVRAFQPNWLRPVLDDVETGFLVECAEVIAYANRAYATLLGYENPKQLVGKHLSQIVAENDVPRLLGFSRMRTQAEPAPVSYEFAARCRDRSAVRLHASVSTSIIEGRVVIATLAGPCRRDAKGTVPKPVECGERAQRLSPREIEVMDMILAGQRPKEIALTLEISPKTVSTHRQRLLAKLQITDNRDLFRYALHHHLIDWS